MKHTRFLFWLIIFLTILAISIDLPNPISVNVESPKIPLLSKNISLHREISPPDLNAILRIFGRQRDFSFRKGLDLAGGTSIILKADVNNIEEDKRDEAVEGAKNVIEKRVNFLGVAEPVVQTATVNNEARIIVELPGITDIDQAVQLVGTTAQLEFRFVKATATQSAFLLYEDTESINLTGADLRDAQVSFDQNTGQPVVLFRVKDKSQKKFFEKTQRLKGKQMAICLDQQCFSAPVVQEAIRDNGQISGGFTTDQAKQLATQLNAGALPVPLTILQQSTVGATLGEQSLQKSLFAGTLGFFVIVIFMSVLYGRLGILASFALMLYVLFVLALFKLIPVTLTLAGIAGLILSVGMAVDANILIFERMREELRMGRGREAAIELGFSRAWSSIRDSNIASLITSAILYYFGTGLVRGFALTLAIGVLVSMFSAIVVTRTFLHVVTKKGI